MHNELAKQIAANRREARRIDRQLCQLLRQAAADAHAAGHIDEPTAAIVIAPKDEP